MTLMIYVAAPFTAPTGHGIAQHIAQAERMGKLISDAGAYPVMPQANTRSFVGEQTPEFWYEATLELMRRCDGVLAIRVSSTTGETSKGVAAELQEAHKLGMPTLDITFAPSPMLAQVVGAWIEKLTPRVANSRIPEAQALLEEFLEINDPELLRTKAQCLRYTNQSPDRAKLR